MSGRAWFGSGLNFQADENSTLKKANWSAPNEQVSSSMHSTECIEWVDDISASALRVFRVEKCVNTAHPEINVSIRNLSASGSRTEMLNCAGSKNSYYNRAKKSSVQSTEEK